MRFLMMCIMLSQVTVPEKKEKEKEDTTFEFGPLISSQIINSVYTYNIPYALFKGRRPRDRWNLETPETHNWRFAYVRSDAGPAIKIDRQEGKLWACDRLDEWAEESCVNPVLLEWPKPKEKK